MFGTVDDVRNSIIGFSARELGYEIDKSELEYECQSCVPIAIKNEPEIDSVVLNVYADIDNLNVFQTLNGLKTDTFYFGSPAAMANYFDDTTYYDMVELGPKGRKILEILLAE